MHTILRLAIGAALFSFGYYLGKQVGMLEPIRSELARARKERDKGTGATRPPNGSTEHGPGN